MPFLIESNHIGGDVVVIVPKVKATEPSTEAAGNAAPAVETGSATPAEEGGNASPAAEGEASPVEVASETTSQPEFKPADAERPEPGNEARRACA